VYLKSKADPYKDYIWQIETNNIQFKQEFVDVDFRNMAQYLQGIKLTSCVMFFEV